MVNHTLKSALFCQKSLPERVVLWGCGELAFSLRLLLIRAGVRDVLIADRYPERFEGEDILCASETDRISKLVEDGTPIIITARFASGASAFGVVFDDLKTRFPAAKLRHPVSVISFADEALMGKVVGFGFPGSGNKIFEVLIRRLITARTGDQKEDPWPSLAKEYEKWVREKLAPLNRDLLGQYNVRSLSLGPDWCEWGVVDPKGYLRIAPLPSMSLLEHGYHVRHATAGELDIDWLQRSKVPLVLIQRHPLDIVVSMASKFVGDDIKRGIVEDVENVSAFREDVRAARLCDKDWFASVLRRSVIFQEEYLSQGDAFKTIKYEDLVSSPSETIVRLSEWIGCPIEFNQAKALWLEFGMKPVASYKLHFNKPGLNKWSSVLDRRHISWVYEALGSDAERRLAQIGYSVDLGTIDRDEIIDGRNVSDEAYEFLRGKCLQFDNVVVDRADGLRGFQVSSSDETFMSFSSILVNSELFRDFLCVVGGDDASMWSKEETTMKS